MFLSRCFTRIKISSLDFQFAGSAHHFNISNFEDLGAHLEELQPFVHHLNVQLNLGFPSVNDGENYIVPTGSISGITAFCETYKV